MTSIQKQRLYYIALFLSICFYGLFSSPACADGKNGQIQTFLADQKVIRVLLDDANGYGNQAASLNVMARLNQLGFHGTYEIIYPNAETTKVANLFQLPENIPDIYDYQDNEYGPIRLIKYSAYVSKFKNNAVDLVTFGFTGAVESDKMTGCSERDDSFDCKKLTANFANFTHSKLFLLLNPWMGEDGRLISISQFQSDNFINIDTPQQYWVMPQITLEQVRAYLKTDAGLELLNKNPGLMSLIDGMQSQQFNYMAVYGWTVTGYFDVNNSDYFYNLMQIITGVRSAQLSGNNDLMKPAVIAVFYDYEKYMEKASQLINSAAWGDFEKPGADNLKKVISQLGLNKPSILITASLSDPSTIQKIHSLKPGQIMLLSMGQLPKQVFDGLYTYTGDNILPQIREGQNSLNSLLLTGKPHLRCREHWELGFDLLKDPILKSQFEKFYTSDDSGFCNADRTWQSNPEIYREVSDWILEAREPQSALSMYFSDIKQEASKPENDKILVGMNEVVKVLNHLH